VDITRFRDREAKALSHATANLSVKVLRVCFGEAVRQGLLTVNPAVRVPVLKTRDKSAGRAFTLPEIKRILKACGDDVEWRGLVLFGLYLGQRLGDLRKAHMARGESRNGRGCVHCAQDRATNRVAARATAQRLADCDALMRSDLA
jgi:integrase